MSEKMTRIGLPGLANGDGFADWGERTAEDMIAIMRMQADRMRKVVAAIDDAADEDFKIDVVRGPHAQHFVRTIQPGKQEQSA